MDGLAAQAESLDERAVALDVGVLQVVQQATTLADEQQEATTAVMVVLVLLEVLGQVRDSSGQQGHLNLGGSGVAVVDGVLLDDLGLGYFCHGGRSTLLRHFSPLRVSLHGAPGPVHRGTIVPWPLHGNRQRISASARGANRGGRDLPTLDA